MTNLTTALKNSIALEESKRSPMNLKNHSCEDLSLMIGLIDDEIKNVHQDTVNRELIIEKSEDLAEITENQMRQAIGFNKKRLDQLYMWRKVFLDAWTAVKMKR